jgi:hypothetical protein
MEGLSMTAEKVKEYIESINLDDYDLGGVEITEEDYEEIAHRVNGTGGNLSNAVDTYLYGIRATLDEGL